MSDTLTEKGSTGDMVDYYENSQAQRQNANRHAGLIRDLAARVSGLSDQLNITDYGCGPGQSAVDTVSPAVEHWFETCPDKQLSVCHADQPGNDWNALMKLIHGPEGYLKGDAALQVRASVGSFYERMMPDQSVTLATCFTASHWLSATLRLNAPETVWFADLTGENRSAMWAQAEADWKRFPQAAGRGTAARRLPAGLNTRCRSGARRDQRPLLHPAVASTARYNMSPRKWRQRDC